jgi:hypothetical protein
MLDELVNKASMDMSLQRLARMTEHTPRAPSITICRVKTLASGAPAPDGGAPSAP